MNPLAETIGTFARIGYLKPGSGTWASACAIPLFWAVNEAVGPFLTIIAIGCVFIAGLWATIEMTRGEEDHDPSEIVIDEVVGQWIALLPVAFGAWHMGIPSLTFLYGWVTAFIAFRVFDIWKPWLVGKYDKRHDAMGVMMDDVIAGVFAAIVVIIAAGVFHIGIEG